MTVAEYVRTRFNPENHFRWAQNSPRRPALWPSGPEAMWAAVPHVGEPHVNSFSVVADGYIADNVSSVAAATLDVLCYCALAAEPLLSEVFRRLTSGPFNHIGWEELMSKPDAPRWLSLLAYRAEQLQAGCRQILSTAFGEGTALVNVRAVYADAGFREDVRWWGLPRRGWDPRNAAGQLRAVPMAELDSVGPAQAAGWSLSGRSHAFGLTLPEPAKSAPFLVSKSALQGSLGHSAVSVDDTNFPSVLVACGPVHR